jgi:hypothetical protein
LQATYGKQSVTRLDIRPLRDEVYVNERPYRAQHLPSTAAVIHGHFSLSGLRRYFPVSGQVPLITWLRDPVARVVSHYHYLAQRLAAEINPSGPGHRVLRVMQRSLLEYAQLPINRNVMSSFLDGAQLEQFTFIGFVEDYNHDLARVGRILGWPASPEFRVNETSGARHVVDDEVARQIREYNKIDVDLYTRALALKAKGHWSPK